MVLLGVVLFVVTVMLWRGAVNDPAVLAPLEIMADRRFARADDEARHGMLDEHRGTAPDVTMEEIESAVLFREPVMEPDRPWVDPFPHDDDAVDIVKSETNVIDPLLRQRPHQSEE